MGERLGLLGLFFVVLGCDGASTAVAYPPEPASAGSAGVGGMGGSGGASLGGSGGASGGSAAGAGGMIDPTEQWTWQPCGTIPYDTFVQTGNYFDISSLAMNGNGSKLVSLGHELFAWDITPSFESSRPEHLGRAGPERPRVEMSPDGRWLAISGDGWYLRSPSGETVGLSVTPALPDVTCFYLQARFSPDGRWLAATTWMGSLEIFAMSDVEGAEQVTARPIRDLPIGCESFAFSPDGTVLQTSGGDRYDTSSWEVLGSGPGSLPVMSWRDSMELASNGGGLVSTCMLDDQSKYVCPGDSAPFPKFSPGGQWIVSGATLRHRLSGQIRVMDPTALVGIFAPNGDVIAAGADNSLTRYCKIE